MVRAIEPKTGLPRVAVVDGVRTPFAKMGTELAGSSALELGALAVRELLVRSELPKAELDLIVFGQVIPSLASPNIAREIGLLLPLPRSVDAFSVSRACATSTQAVATACALIQAGQAKVAVAGGADSASDVPIPVSEPLREALMRASQAKKAIDKVASFSHLSAKDLLPAKPELREPSTGLTMGESAEKMAKENNISRSDQDAFAHRSHVRAAKAWSEGLFAREVITVYTRPDRAPFSEDNLVRKGSSLEAYAKLKPVFDPRWGTVTAGSSSALTDGAAALLLMHEATARALGYRPLGFVRSFAFAALDPSEQLLMGPAYAAPRALDAAGATLRDMTLVDLHEAFSAQVLSNLQAFASKRFAEEKLGRSGALGEVDETRLNVHGGSIALGHPFAATGARQITTVLRELARRGGGLGLIAQCAAGGLGAALVVESAGA